MNRRTPFQRVTVVLMLICLFSASQFAFNHPASVAAQQSVPDKIAGGKRLFAGACSNSYCHGNEGAGGSGPKLINRNFTAEHVARVISEGVKGTAMPAFKGAYSRDEIEQLVAYVLSLSPETKGAVDPHFNPEVAKAADAPAVSAPKAVLTERDREFLKGGNLEAGRALFFNPYVFESCRVCHTFNDKGGLIGPDLSSIGSRPAEEIYQSIISPHAVVTPKYETIAVTTRAGQRIVGVRRDEDATTIRIYDTASLPPVSRTILKAEITKTERLKTSAMPDNYGTRYTQGQLIDLVTFLKTGN
jgi:putative heme-binding domain-containing protein